MLQRTEFDRIRSTIEEADADGPLTAREIVELLQQQGADIDSPHTVATILGKQARRGEVEVIDGQPYRYRV